MLHLLLAFAQQINKINFRCRCQNRQRRLRCVSFMRLAFVTKSNAPWSRPGLGLGPGSGDNNDDNDNDSNYISISRCGIFYCDASRFYGAQVYDIALTVALATRCLPHATRRVAVAVAVAVAAARWSLKSQLEINECLVTHQYTLTHTNTYSILSRRLAPTFANN